jgi:endonuclease/exonuclease/phosphatase (EEP) superfamily protein YafD
MVNLYDEDTSIFVRTAPARWRRIATVCLGIGVVLLAFLVGAALIPVFPFTLLEHFRIQYAAFGLFLVVCAAGLRSGPWFDAALITTLVTVILLVPGLRSAPRPLPANGVAIRVLLLNVHTSNKSTAKVEKLIRDTNPDVVALVEIDRAWATALAPVLASYGGRIEHTRPDNFGLGLYARGRVEGAVESVGSDLPTIVAGVAIGEATFSMVVTHPLPPVSSARYGEHRDQLEAVAAVVGTLPAPVIVAGDLNATPWSRPFARLVGATGLCDTRNGFGVGATFPTYNVLARVPIDHVLVSCSIGVADRRVERDVDSDHFPVVVDLVVRSCPHGRWCD